MCFGGSKTEVVVPPPPEPTPAETRQNQLTNQLLELNISSQGFEIEEGPEGPRIVERELTPEQQERKEKDAERDLALTDLIFKQLEEAGGGKLTERQQQIKDLTEERQLEALSGVPSERTKELVGETFESARTMGEEDIQRFATELAGRRGLERTDDPVSGAAFKAQTDLTTGLRSAEAGALLDVGQRNQLFGQNLREFQAGLNLDRLNSVMSVADFQNALRQQATQNRMALGTAASGLAGQSGALRASLFQPQLVKSTSAGIGPLLSGLGGLAGGVAGFFPRPV